MKKNLLGFMIVAIMALSSCSIFVSTRHHSVKAGVSDNSIKKDTLKTESVR